MIDLRQGPWQTALDGVTVDAMICDPPYSAKTHDGHDTGASGANAGTWARANGRVEKKSFDRRSIDYGSMTPGQVTEFVASWCPRVAGWWAVLSDSVLSPVWRSELERFGLCTFQPLPLIIPGMTVRLSGDGPSSMCVWLTVARPRAKPYSNWGTLPGYYIGTRKDRQHIGGKPVDIMAAIIRDYTKPGDLVCDPFAGWATTLIAARSLNRRSIGSEMDPETYAAASRRIGAGSTADLFEVTK